MEQVVYGDVLFLINFSMDALALFVGGKLLHRKIRIGRICAASALGALYAVVSLLLPGNVIICVALNAAVSALMCFVAFGGRILPCMALLYAVSFLTGGVATAIYGAANKFRGAQIYTDGSVKMLSGNIPLAWVAASALLCAAASLTGGRLADKRGVGKPVKIILMHQNKTLRLTGMVDSGNLITEPVGGLPVIVVNRGTMSNIAPAELVELFRDANISDFALSFPERMKKVRLIPVSSVTGRGMLVGFVPDRVIVDEIERAACVAAYALSDSQDTDFAGTDAIVPVSLCK